MLGLGVRRGASSGAGRFGRRGWIARSLLLAGLAFGAESAVVSSCSLGNINPDDCGTEKECSDVFGLGSKCEDGYCTAGQACATGHDCRTKLGFGACVANRCQIPPPHPACTIVEPPDILAKSVFATPPPFIIGGIASLEEDFDVALVRAMQLAVLEINRSGGMNDGRELGIVVCDNGGPDNSLQGTEREVKNQEALDYLAGVLGVPAIVGPLSSTDSVSLVSHLLQRQYPTAIISPAATSTLLTNQPDKVPDDADYGLFWRTCPSDELQGTVLADNVIGPDPAVTKVAVIYVQDSYGEGLSSVFREAYGSASTVALPYSDVSDVGTVAQLAIDEAPDGVLIISVQSSEVIAFLQAFVGTSLEGVKFFLTDGAKSDALLDPTLPAAVRTMIQNARGTGPAKPSGNNYDLFRVNLLKDYDIDADLFGFIANTYDATYVAAYGVAYSAGAYGNGFDGNEVTEGLSRLSSGDGIDVGPTDWATAKTGLTMDPFTVDIIGTSGPLNFDASTGEAPGPIEVWGVSSDFTEFTQIDVIEPP